LVFSSVFSKNQNNLTEDSNYETNPILFNDESESAARERIEESMDREDIEWENAYDERERHKRELEQQLKIRQLELEQEQVFFKNLNVLHN
jgi:hypothetical protein